jgi:hypothetical protein
MKRFKKGNAFLNVMHEAKIYNPNINTEKTQYALESGDRITIKNSFKSTQTLIYLGKSTENKYRFSYETTSKLSEKSNSTLFEVPAGKKKFSLDDCILENNPELKNFKFKISKRSFMKRIFYPEDNSIILQYISQTEGSQKYTSQIHAAQSYVAKKNHAQKRIAQSIMVNDDDMPTHPLPPVKEHRVEERLLQTGDTLTIYKNGKSSSHLTYLGNNLDKPFFVHTQFIDNKSYNKEIELSHGQNELRINGTRIKLSRAQETSVMLKYAL